MSESLRRRQNRLLRTAHKRELDELTARAREHHLLFRQKREKEIKIRRSQMKLGARIDAALAQARTLSATSSAPLGGRISQGKASSSAPPGADQFLAGEGTVADTFERRFRLLVEAVEREIDAHRQRPLDAEVVRETSEERDKRLIRDFEGFHPEEIIFMDPSFGSSKAVERARVRMEHDALTGRPRRKR